MPKKEGVVGGTNGSPTYIIDKNVKENADRLGVIIKPSTKKFKKLDVFSKTGDKLVSVGDTRYQDYNSYIKSKGLEYANQRKKLYNIRHNKTKNVKGSPSYWANQLLWK